MWQLMWESNRVCRTRCRAPIRLWPSVLWRRKARKERRGKNEPRDFPHLVPITALLFRSFRPPSPPRRWNKRPAASRTLADASFPKYTRPRAGDIYSSCRRRREEREAIWDGETRQERRARQSSSRRESRDCFPSARSLLGEKESRLNA